MSFMKQIFIKSRMENFVLKLRLGESVEVLNESEIAATLDQDGTLEGLPFISEMHKYCGRRFTVLKYVNKVWVEGVGPRGINNTVILEGVTCDGEAHGGCQRTCHLLWKEAWLKRTNDNSLRKSVRDSRIFNKNIDKSNMPDGIFRCQSPSLTDATFRLPISFEYFIRKYICDEKLRKFWPFRKLCTLLLWLTIKVKSLLGLKNYARLSGQRKITPTISLNLQPGELVELENKDEILNTIDTNSRNRGLAFTPEMVKYLKHRGVKYRVLKRIDKIIDEKTGRMRRTTNTVMLEGTTCDGSAHHNCPRTCNILWREIWLKRVG